MRKLNKPKVYLSYSLQDTSDVLLKTKFVLQSFGIECLSYEKGETYTTDKIAKADFVIFITKGESYLTHSNKQNAVAHTVGKGQFTEAEYCLKNDIPAFVLTDVIENVIKGTKIFDKPRVYNTLDWKHEYGHIISTPDECNINLLFNFEQSISTRFLLI